MACLPGRGLRGQSGLAFFSLTCLVRTMNHLSSDEFLPASDSNLLGSRMAHVELFAEMYIRAYDYTTQPVAGIILQRAGRGFDFLPTSRSAQLDRYNGMDNSERGLMTRKGLTFTTSHHRFRPQSRTLLARLHQCRRQRCRHWCARRPERHGTRTRRRTSGGR